MRVILNGDSEVYVVVRNHDFYEQVNPAHTQTSSLHQVSASLHSGFGSKSAKRSLSFFVAALLQLRGSVTSIHASI